MLNAPLETLSEKHSLILHTRYCRQYENFRSETQLKLNNNLVIIIIIIIIIKINWMLALVLLFLMEVDLSDHASIAKVAKTNSTRYSRRYYPKAGKLICMHSEGSTIKGWQWPVQTREHCFACFALRGKHLQQPEIVST